MNTKPKVAIIGAGLAGVSLANALGEQADITLFEKSRGAGGRMSTRRHEQISFDHGAQFFTARSRQFQQVVSEAANKHIVTQWNPKILNLELGTKPFKREWFEPHFYGNQGMNSLAKYLAKDLQVVTGFHVAELLKLDSSWFLMEKSGQQAGPFDWVISAAPAPQAADLMPPVFLHHDKIQEARFSACFALMLGFEESTDLNFDAAVVKHPVLAWLATRSDRQMLVHSNNEWASENIEKDPAVIEGAMLAALREILPELAAPNHQSLHRWRYARCEDYLDQDYLLDKTNRLAAVGDWCRGNRVEDAFLSGLELAQWLSTDFA